MDPNQYAHRIALERLYYADREVIHELPGIFDYWSNTFLRPRLAQFGYSSPNDMFQKVLETQCAQGGQAVFVSIGSGNCELEVDLALSLRAKGYEDFEFHCLDLNEAMLTRGRAAAEQTSLERQFRFLQGDFNLWNATDEYDAVIANQSLHHVVNLEGLLGTIGSSLKPGGVLAVSDMIGRNGHLRWPAALDIVQSFWSQLPPSYRINRVSGCYEETFRNRDCSVEGFEGIRAQDILSLLNDSFHFDFFFPFANIVDPFLDRSFGPNFRTANEWDRRFIDTVHEVDQAAMREGIIGPTHLLAILSKSKEGSSVTDGNLTPEHCLRAIEKSKQHAPAEWVTRREIGFPHSSEDEARELALGLAESQKRVDELKDSLAAAYRDLESRTKWAWDLEKELLSTKDWAVIIDRQLEELRHIHVDLQQDHVDKTEWALDLDRQLAIRGTHIVALQEELAVMTAENQRLQDQLQGVSWAIKLRAAVITLKRFLTSR